MNCFRLKVVRNDIVYIFNKDDVCIYFVEVFNQCPVSTRTEKQGTVCLTEEVVILCYGNCVCASLLL